ncbi:MAG: GTP 3',8-cyclase MoaA [Pirellulales bacterium]|nr:GTP 3',8-cyclase MoaA [Pirellulales bacterium]
MHDDSLLGDRFGRIHTDLRVSVTDRCNIRCFYCMPAENVRFRPRAEILSFEEIARFVRVVSRLGIRTVRLTGGEPLVRHGLPRLVEMLVALPGIDEVSLTTNGLLLAEQAGALRAAGLSRLNVSLDTLDPARFREITRRDGFERVLEGLFAAQRAGFSRIKVNAVAIRGLTEPDIVPLAEFARRHGFEVRFIEYMPLDADGHWENGQVLAGSEVREIIERALGPLEPIVGRDPAQPAVDYQFVDGSGRVGFINSVTEPFCGDCDRLRLTAEGKLRNCLFSTTEWDARAILRGGRADVDTLLTTLVRDCVREKRRAHGINTDEFIRPERAMYQIGG